jgi:hypothetical protein
MVASKLAGNAAADSTAGAGDNSDWFVKTVE